MKQLTEEEYRNIYGGRPIIIIHENGKYEIINVPD